MTLHRALSDRRRYRRQIDRLHQRHLFSRELYELKQSEVSLARVVHKRRKVSRILARTVARGTYRFEPGTLRTIVVNDKEREVYAFRLTDLIVHGVVGDLVQERSAHLLSHCLYSYQKGRSWWTAVADFGRFIRAHRSERPDPRSRGLYVIRRDIDSYTDTIPLGRNSPAWRMLREVLGPGSPHDWRVVEQVVRPVMHTPPEGPISRFRGVPTGQPISVAMFNLYLAAFDREFDAIPGGFYARYSDDILFAHPDPDIVRTARGRMDALLPDLDLTFKSEKEQLLYFTGAGRRSEVWPEARGVTSVPFLGTSLWFNGTVSLSKNKARELLRDIEERAVRTAATLNGDQEVTGRVVAAVVNDVFRPRQSPFQQRSATLVRRAVTDRSQLRQLDYQIAKIVIGAVTGDRSVRAFRRVPYRKVREDWGLRSLVHERDRWGKGRAVEP
jgi:hypothetical protein